MEHGDLNLKATPYPMLHTSTLSCYAGLSSFESYNKAHAQSAGSHNRDHCIWAGKWGEHTRSVSADHQRMAEQWSEGRQKLPCSGLATITAGSCHLYIYIFAESRPLCAPFKRSTTY